MTRGTKYYSGGILFVTMFIMAMAENVIGVIVPPVRQAFDLNVSEMSLIFSLSTLSYTIGTYVSGRVAEKVGPAKTEQMAIIGLVMGCVALGIADNYALFVLGIMVLNVSLAANGVIINGTIPVMFEQRQALMINGLHFMYGMGATLSRRLNGFFLGQGVVYGKLYLILGALGALAFLASFLINYPDEEAIEEQLVDHDTLATRIYRDPRYLLIGFAMGTYLFVEVGIGNWLVDYLHVGHGMNEDVGSTYSAFFFLAIALGRLVGGFVVDKLGRMQSIFTGGMIGISLVILGLIFQGPFLYLISAAGLFFSIVFPTTILVIHRAFPRSLGNMTSRVLTLTFLTMMICNQIFGLAVDRFGFQWMIFTIPIAGLVSIALFSYLSHKYPYLR